MFPLFINYFFTFLSIFILYFIITYDFSKQTNHCFNSICVALLCAYIIVKIPVSSSTIRFFLLLFFSIIYIYCFSKEKIKIIFSATFISLGISLAIYSISVIVVTAYFLLICSKQITNPTSLTNILVGIIQLLFLYKLTHIKRFKSGIQKIIYNSNIAIYILIILFFCICLANISNYKHSFSQLNRLSINILLFTLSLLLLYYWRHRIKQTYIENMRRLEILNYENSIADKDKHIRELENQNAHLGKIIHKYRKVIPAMELSVMELFQNSEGLSVEELKDKAKSLQTQLEELHAERNNLLDQYQKETATTSMTGLHTIDAMLALMEKRAKQEWIRFKTQIAPDIKELASHSIKEADLLHMLGDLIENAFHAVNAGDNKEIMIHLGKLNDCLLFEVSDSGSAFDIQTYQHIGNEPFTSRKEDGGTGTGLMDIWSIKKKYKASLYIYEYEPETNIYTKKISFLFDGKNHFLLKTYRDKEIRNTLIRGDLHVFSHQTD